MEEQIRCMLDKNEDPESKQNIKEVRVIRGKQLQEIGMNLFYAVG
jgi:leucyl aminopeptidase